MFHCTDYNAQSFIFICYIKYSVYSYGLEIKGMMWQKYGDAYCKTLKTTMKSKKNFALGRNLGMIPSPSPQMATFTLNETSF